MKKLLLVFLLTLGNSVYGQVLSIDRLSEQDTIKRTFRVFTALSFSNEKQKKALLDFTNKTELYYFTKRDYLVGLLAQVDVALNGKTINENNGFFQLRFRDNDTRKISPDFFTQYQWNGIQGMEHRFLLGVNARFKFFEKKKSDLFAGIGVFQENERWNPTLAAYAFSVDSLSVINRNMLRLNTTAKFALLLGKNTELTGTTFVQFPLNSNFVSPRWFLDLNMNFNFSKHLSFSIHYDHNLDAFRPLPIDTYFYATTMGIQLRW